MKKILALVLTMCLLCGGLAVADTEIKQDSTNKTAQTTVSYTIATNETYTVTIPSSTSLEEQEGKYSSIMSIHLNTSSFNVAGKTVAVKLTGSTNDFKLVNTVDSEKKIAYTVKKNGEECAADHIVASWTMGELRDQYATIVAEITDSLVNFPAGEYTDTLTFTVSVTGGNSNAGGIAGDVETPEISNPTIED